MGDCGCSRCAAAASRSRLRSSRDIAIALMRSNNDLVIDWVRISDFAALSRPHQLLPERWIHYGARAASARDTRDDATQAHPTSSE